MSIDQLRQRETARHSLSEQGMRGESGEHARLLREFEVVLEEDVHLNADERETILTQYADALRKTPVELGAPDVDGLKESFRFAIDAMLADNALSPSERQSLESQLNDALQGMDSPEVKRATEYARRLKEEGPENAAAWLADASGNSSPKSMEGQELRDRSGPSRETPRRRRRI